jgi:hydrocephalus-inducing protein
MKFNEQGTKSFEIRNEGLFEFNYAIYEQGDAARIKELKEEQQKIYEEMDTLVIEDKKKGKKEEKPKKAAPPVKKGQLDPLALAISQYTLTPSYGTIPPNSAVQIDVAFKAVGNSTYEAKLCIDITNRSPNMFPEGIPYELQGESCIPMINNSNFELIFEEQIVVPSLNSTGRNIQDIVNSNIFATEERCFYFGTVIPSKNSNEDVKEKFKIVNNGKVHVEVKFQVKKKQSSTNDNFPFSVTSEIAKIPPHEHMYVEVTFAPTIMTTYSGVFEAVVINSDPAFPQFNNLTFDLRGDGAMPTLKLEKPKEWINESTPLLKFSKTRLGKRAVESIVIKNDGLIPATVKFDVTQHKDFKFISQNSYTLTPKSVQSFQIEYCPNSVGESQWEIFFNTLLNPYEQTKVIIKGECFFEGITFENLPNDKDDQIMFGDVVAGASKKITFFIKNHTEKNMRISTDTNNSECLSIKPSIGHLAKKGTKTFHATIKSDKKISLEAFKTYFITQEIKQKEEKWNDWDNGRKKRKMITATEFNWLEACQAAEEKIKAEEQELLRKGKKVPKRPENYLPKKPDISLDEKRDIEYEETVSEPTFEALGSEKKIELLVFAKVDSVRYICDTKNVQFKSTMMFGSRVYEFKVKNDSIIEMQYKWDFLTREGISDPGYYKVTPNAGSIGPEQEETFQLKFAPTEIENDQSRALVCLMPNLAANLDPLQINVDSLTERPICHFELELTNYLNSRTGDISEVDISKLKVIEFESLGIKVKNRKRFYIVNPTATGYDFVWKRVDVDLGGSANISTFFQCVTEKGVILSGKKFEMSFEYKPEIQGLHESLWVFEIPTFNLKQYFLIVGKVVEPKVFFEVGKVDFGPLLLGGKNKEVIKLKNLDYLPYQFNFNRNSIKGENEYADSLNIEPMSGVLNGDSEIPLTVTFKPKIEGHYNYNIICNVAQKPRPINLNVKGIGYMLHHAIYLNNTTAVLNPNVLNEIDFGNIYVNEKKIRTISIKNNGDFNFDFMIKKSSFNYVSIMPETATVKTGSKLDLEVIFNPLKDYKLRPNLHTFTLSIVSGPIYHFKLNGGARKPSVEVSFSSYDFGPCFVMKTPIKKTVILKMRNMDDSAISIEPLFEKKSYLEVQLFSGQVLLPFDKDHPETSVLDIPIHFTAREIGKIDEIISFDINQLHKVDVRIQGEGVPMRLDLKRPEDSFIDFGICSVGSNNTMLIPIANHSRSEIKIDFDVDKQLEELRKLFIAVLPKGPFVVNAKESKDIEISFNPNIRVNSFKKEIRYKIVENDETVQMLTLQGASQGMDLKLMEDSINFGSVVVGSKLTKKTQLNNLGDMGAKFEWDTTFCKSFFTITPKKGFLPSNDSVLFQIEFHPTVTEDHNFTIRCHIENGNPIMMTLKGKGTSQVTEGLQTLKFESVVRTKTSQKVSIKNPTGEKIMIKANFTTTTDRFKGFFFGQEGIQIAPNDKADYEINYLPLTMTANAKAPKIKDEAHEGRIFFPMPDGSALSYNLSGKSNPPAVIETIAVSFKAKSDNIQIINLKNWLKEAQRLAVIIEPDTKDDSVIIIGTNTIDLPAESSKKYKLNLYALKQGAHRVTVTFRNTNTDEFIFYVLNLTITPADPIESFELTSVVRESVKKVVSILNPLDRQVEIKKESIICDTDTITLNPRTFIIPAKSVGTLSYT